MPVDILEPLTQFGVAGLMGALWIWERLLSRRRERQLTESHGKLLQQRNELRVLIGLVHETTRAIERFDQTQKEFRSFLERVHNDIVRRTV